MKYSSQKLGKILKQTEEELNSLLLKEEKSKEFHVALGENAETVRPKYSFSETQTKRETLEKKIMAIKHALNLYNVSTVIPELNVTIDQALVYLPQLIKKKRMLADMKDKLPKRRVESTAYKTINLIDYVYINYDLDEVEKKYNEVAETLSQAQIALDKINSIDSIDIELD